MNSTSGRTFFTITLILLLSVLVIGISLKALLADYLGDSTLDRLENDAKVVADLTASYYTEDRIGTMDFLVNLDVTSKVSGADAVICDNRGCILLCASEPLGCEHQGMFIGESYLRSGYSFVSFSTERAAVASKPVRQAIAYSMDKQALIEDTVGQYGQAVHGHYGVGQWVYQLVEGKIEPPVDKPVSGASASMIADYKKEAAKWEALSLDGVKQYGLDLAAAESLLIADGWTLNLAGEDFDSAEDSVRCKKIDETIVPLQLSLIYPEGNAAGEYLSTAFAANLAEIGIELAVEAKPFTEMLEIY